MEVAEQVAAPGQRSKARALWALARPHQWIKNGVVLAALVFSKRLFVPLSLIEALTALAAFCAISSATYAVNDLADREADRLHPEKRSRPLASGELTPEEGIRFVAAAGAGGLALGAFLGPGFFILVIAYLLLQYCYSRFLKSIVIVDIIAVALGFVLRAYGGGVAIGVEVSQWLVFTTFLVALFLVLAKRRHELVVLGDGAEAHRSALQDYSLGLIDQLSSVVAAATLVAYMIYTVSPEVEQKLHTHQLYLTVPFVAFGIFRYLYLSMERTRAGDPARLLISDRQLLIALALWIVTDIAVLYL